MMNGGSATAISRVWLVPPVFQRRNEQSSSSKSCFSCRAHDQSGETSTRAARKVGGDHGEPIRHGIVATTRNNAFRFLDLPERLRKTGRHGPPPALTYRMR